MRKISVSVIKGVSRKIFICFAFYFYRANISRSVWWRFSFAFFYDVTTFVLESNADKWLERVKGTKIFSTKHSSATSIIYTYRYPIEQLSLHTNDFWDNVHDHLFVSSYLRFFSYYIWDVVVVVGHVES